MRKSFQLKLMAAAAFLPYSNPVEAGPTARSSFMSTAHNGHVLRAKPETVSDLDSLAAEIMAIAGKDVVFVDPRYFTSDDYKDFMSIPVFDHHVIKFPPVPISAKDPDYIKRVKQNQNRSNAALTEVMRSQFFEITLQSVQAIKGGKNYYAAPYSGGRYKACLIAGDMGAPAVNLAAMIGSVPEALQTQDFKNKFNDSRSLLTFVTLHEASHCAQDTSHVKGGFPSTRDILTLEIEADRPALQRYREMVAQGVALDPRMPEKMKDLRRVSPYLQTGLGPLAFMAMAQQDHVTADALDKEAYDAQKIIHDTLAANLLVKSVIYQSIDESTRAEKERIAAPQVDLVISRLARPVSPKILAANPGRKRQAEMEKQMYDVMRPLMLKFAVVDSVSHDQPEIIYAALKYLAANVVNIDLMESKSSSNPAMFESVVASWQGLGLTQDETKATEFSLNSSLPSKDALTGKLRASDFAITAEFRDIIVKLNDVFTVVPKPSAPERTPTP